MIYNMKTRETLYCKDTKGKIRQWSVSYNQSAYKQYYGLLDGKLASNATFVTEGKNYGKSNETTVEEQVEKEVEALYKKKKQEGYKSLDDLNLRDVEDPRYNEIINIHHTLNTHLPTYKTSGDGYLKPMKAQPYKKGCMEFPVLIQPKINGVRCTAKLHQVNDGLFGINWRVELRSKEGLRYEVKHLEEQFEKIIGTDTEIVIDGELYIAGQTVTSIGGAARNPNNLLHDKLAFIAFDLSMENEIQIDRIHLLGQLDITEHHYQTFGLMNTTNQLINEVFVCPTIKVSSEELLQSYHKDFLAFGFEGTIIRDQYAEYKFGSRPKTMRKLKQWMDSEFKILDIVAGTDGKAIFICKNDTNDLTFRVDGTVEFLDPQLIIDKDDYIGKLATVKFYERTITKLPFHGTLIAIRNYE